MRTILLTLVLTALATPALASDGVLEISQTCAVQTGCFAGDTPGFPVTITEPGTSYVLTSRLIVPDENTDGIVISTSDVGIDLNNFAIIRSGCEGATTDCRAIGTGSGVERTSSSLRGLSVKNGSITGMGDEGVRLGEQAEVTNLRVRWNGLEGINAGEGSTVSGNTAYQNGRTGILVGDASIVSGNTAYLNVNNGIICGDGSTVSGNTAYQNGFNGINTAGSGSTISGNTTRRNGWNGISGGSGSVISDNSSNENTLDGIEAGAGSTIRGNSVRGNDAWGLDILSTRSAYRENTISTLGTALGTVNNGIDAGGNVCNGSLTCP